MKDFHGTLPNSASEGTGARSLPQPGACCPSGIERRNFPPRGVFPRKSKLPETPGRSTGCRICPFADSRVRMLNRRRARESETPVWWFVSESGKRIQEEDPVPLGLIPKPGFEAR